MELGFTAMSGDRLIGITMFMTPHFSQARKRERKRNGGGSNKLLLNSAPRSVKLLIKPSAKFASTEVGCCERSMFALITFTLWSRHTVNPQKYSTISKHMRHVVCAKRACGRAIYPPGPRTAA